MVVQSQTTTSNIAEIAEMHMLSELEEKSLERPIPLPEYINRCMEHAACCGFSGQDLHEKYRLIQLELRLVRYDDRNSPAQYLD